MSLITRLITTRFTVHPGTQLVEYVRGVFTRELGPGRHKRPRHATYRAVRTQEQLTSVAVQEVPTVDGLTLRVSAAIRWTVADARRYVEVAEAPMDGVYLAAQVALREAVADVPATEAAAHVRRTAGGTMLAAATAAATAVGIEILDVVVKDVIVPFELRAAQAELVTARAKGEVQLAKARADAAALRSLANAAALLDQHPALARLRLVEALPHGTTLELGLPGD